MKKNKFFSILLALVLIIGVLPVKAEASNIYKNNVVKVKAEFKPGIAKTGDQLKAKFILENISKYDLKDASFELREIGSKEGKANKFFKLNTANADNLEVRKIQLKKAEKTELAYDLITNCELKCGRYPISISLKVGEAEFVDKVMIEIYNGCDKKTDALTDGNDNAPSIEKLPVLPEQVDPNKELAPQLKDLDKDNSKDNNKDDKKDDNKDPQKPDTKVDPQKPIVPNVIVPENITPPQTGGNGGDTPFIDSQSGGSSSTSGAPVKNKPKLIIDRYSFEPKTPQAGEEFTMNLSFYNTNADKSVRNIKIFLTSNDSAESAVQGSRPTSSSVFTPVNSSNTFYIPAIDAGGKVQKAITLSTSQTLAAKNYQVTANFEYEDKDGNEYTAQELIGIPIVQKTKLDTSEVTLPQQGFVGEPVDGSIQFYNTGKDTLYNLMVKLEGDVNTETKQYYVGNFQSGASDTFSLSFSPKNPGMTKGKVTFSYEDSTGQQQKQEKEFSLNVEEQQTPQNDLPIGPDGKLIDPSIPDSPKKTSPLTLALSGLGLLAVAAVVVVVVKKRKAKKNNEDLLIDEDK